MCLTYMINTFLEVIESPNIHILLQILTDVLQLWRLAHLILPGVLWMAKRETIFPVIGYSPPQGVASQREPFVRFSKKVSSFEALITP